MKKLLIILVSICCLGAMEAYAQMTDDALMQYITESVAEGKSKNHLASELAAKGVSATQMKRVLAKVKKEQGVQVSSVSTDKTDSGNRTRKQATIVNDIREKDREPYKKDSTSTQTGKKIYGHDIFTSKTLSFEPNQNAATPDSYVLGPGDEVIIDIWGENEATIKQTISPEGKIIVSQIGPIQLSGLTIDAARARIRKNFASKYAALNGSASQISVTLGEARTIMVNVMGEVKVPGTYRLSSFATVFNALYNAGGVTEIGSVRAVKVSRGSEIIATVDLYQYLFNGYAATDIILKDGDVIIVPSSGLLVEVKGKAKRPMYYELVEGETLADALGYAGGFDSDAYRGDISIIRQTGGEQIVRSVKEDSYSTFALEDGDSFEIQPALERYADKLELKGAVKRPGVYQYGDEVKTLSQLIERGGGLREDAFKGRVQIVREREDLTLEVIAVSLGDILDGTEPDLLLKSNDQVYISCVSDIDKKGDFTINGYVSQPGDYPYAENTTIEDLILMAGGLMEGASTANVEVSRRIVDPESSEATGKLADIFNFAIKDGLVADGRNSFVLQPYDVVNVRKSPSFVEQRTATVLGEVVFPGQYTLKSDTERVSDVLTRSGGITKSANIKGGIIRRKVTEEERELRKTIAEVYKNSVEEEKDTTGIEVIPEIYNVGVDLEKALDNPGSEYDIVLRDGDEIVIPMMSNTVSIQGEVLFPNVVSFMEGRSVKYYINQAGGFTERSRKGHTYVVHANGTVSSGMFAKVDSGSSIVVPRKAERKEVTTGEIIGIASSATSLTTMVLYLINVLK